MYKPKKKYGQHFLNDISILRSIVENAELKENDIVWEIGAGLGNLTDVLLEKNIYLTLFEIDDELVGYLTRKYVDASLDLTPPLPPLITTPPLPPLIEGGEPPPSLRGGRGGVNLGGLSIKIIPGDFIKIIDKYIKSQKDLKHVKIVTNLPYQISSPFLFKIAENHEIFCTIVVMLQKEVAKRVCSSPGTKDYGVLSLKIQYYFKVVYLFDVTKEKFSPPPDVESAVIKLTPREKRPVIKNIDFFWKIVEKCFSQRRKTLRNNLKKMFENSIDNPECPIDLNRRGETLSEEEFISLYNFILQVINSGK